MVIIIITTTRLQQQGKQTRGKNGLQEQWIHDAGTEPSNNPGAKKKKINRPQMELKKLFKCHHPRMLNREQRLKHLLVRAVMDAGLTTGHHHKKRASSARANITLSGKKRRKLLQQIRLSHKEKTSMEVEPPLKPGRTNESQPKRQKKTKVPHSNPPGHRHGRP
ncbi:uncharacterized protein C11orf98-like [Erinaceus europaeus]|uniref:Uncharacterized protein C11orf98-like n=1 Tax=Erinaceus europaeus TaxID=9365 RepID=A0ABM3YJ15_ERIEU|nr:uncharacterized protein C11orf98-like [Erinaceus europaeus]